MSTVKAINIQHPSSASPNIVGDANGNITVAGAVSMGSSFLRNRIINGDMRIDQRNAGSAVNLTTSNQYTIDRWYCSAGSTVSGTLTAQRVATSSPGNPQYVLRLARTSGTFASYLFAGQVIETLNCYDLAGKTITVSFKVRAGSSYTGGTFSSWIRTGTAADEGNAGSTAGNWTGYAQAGQSGNLTPTTSLVTYSYSVTLGSSVQEIAVGFATGNFSGSGSANDYLDITDVQIEIGTVATPFERRSHGEMILLCQRYYEKSYNQTTAVGSAWSINGSQGIGASHPTSNFRFGGSFKVTKRTTTPVFTVYDSLGASGAVSYYTSSWLNGGTTFSVTPTATDSGFYLGHNIASSVETQFAWVVNAEL